MIAAQSYNSLKTFYKLYPWSLQP